jgi:hypothetical protein
MVLPIRIMRSLIGSADRPRPTDGIWADGIYIDEFTEFTEEQQRYVAAVCGIRTGAPPDLGDVIKDEAPPVKGPTLPRQLPHQNKRRSLPPKKYGR